MEDSKGQGRPRKKPKWFFRSSPQGAHTTPLPALPGSTIGLTSTMYVRAKAVRASARRIDRSPKDQSSAVSALTSAITAAFTDSGSVGHALTMACKSGSSCISLLVFDWSSPEVFEIPALMSHGIS